MRKLNYTKIGQRIRQVRKARGWTQGTLAGKCGISMSFMGHIERGSRIMSIDTFAAVCESLDIKADELLWGIPEPTEASLAVTWNGAETEHADNYTTYLKIMKSVAEIMGEK